MITSKIQSRALCSLLVGFVFSMSLSAQDSPLGIWKTIDDKTGLAKSHVEIYEQDGLYFGKIVQLLLRPADTVCESCKGHKKNQPLIGMVILEDLKKHKDYWSYGRILDPENGKVYKCSVYLEEGKLRLRGYIGFSMVGRNQYWEKIN